MGQLTSELADKLWPQKSEKIWFLIHTKDGGVALDRCLTSVQPLTDNIVCLIDSRTTDDSREICDRHGVFRNAFHWKHSFSYAKNLCIQKAMEQGLQFGDWILVMGDDFELQPHAIPEIEDFVTDPTNFFAQFWVP